MEQIMTLGGLLMAIAKTVALITKLGLTGVFILAILFGEFDRRKWWCYLVMVLSIIFIWV